MKPHIKDTNGTRVEECKTCGTKLEMYYEKFCPGCYDPTTDKIEMFNLLKCLYHLDVIEPGFKDTFWNDILMNYQFTNDSGIDLYFDDENEERYEMLKKLQAFIKTDKDHAYFWISW